MAEAMSHVIALEPTIILTPARCGLDTAVEGPFGKGVDTTMVSIVRIRKPMATEPSIDRP